MRLKAIATAYLRAGSPNRLALNHIVEDLKSDCSSFGKELWLKALVNIIDERQFGAGSAQSFNG